MNEKIIDNGIGAAQELLRRITKLGAEDAIVSFMFEEESQVKFSNSRINNQMTYQPSSLSVFASFGKRIVATSIRDIEKKSVRRTAEDIARFARKLKPNPNYMGIAQGPFKYRKDPSLYDRQVENLGEGIVDYAESAVSEASRGKVSRVAGNLEASSSYEYIITSSRVEGEFKSTQIYLSTRAIVDKEHSAHSVAVSRNLKGFNAEQCASESAELANEIFSDVKIKPGRYDVLFYPLPFASLVELTAYSCSIFEVEAGSSFLENKLEKQVSSRDFTLMDDPTQEGGIGSVLFDDEGVPAKRKALIENGVLKTYLHNTSTARRYGIESTGNAGLIIPTPFNIVLKPGKSEIDNMISSIKKGLIVTNLWYTRFQNYRTGEFSTLPRDQVFYIKNGRIIGQARRIRISDTMPNILKNVSSIGKNSKKIIGWEVETPVETPPVLIRQVGITRPE
ncbi:MAG: TldD/PmbA family protein [Candidatus Woesearchaeota archaeon]